MARIVLTSWGSYGDLNPYVGLAKALAARGHQPVIATCEYYRGAVARAGIEFHAVRPDIDPSDKAIATRVMDVYRGPEVLLREYLFPSVEQSFDDLRTAVTGADLLISHPGTVAAPIVAAVTGIAWISSVLAPLSFFSRLDMPVLPRAPWLKSLERLGAWPATAILAIARRVTRSWSEPVRALRARLGLPAGGDPIYEGQHSPGLVLALFSRVLAEPQPDWPPNVCVTGQVQDDSAQGAALSAELSRFLDAGPAPIVFTLGSSAVRVAEGFYEHSAEAATRLERRAVLLAGPGGPERLARHLSPDVIALDVAPHSLLFPRSAAVVQQCGIGTLGSALRAGRPILAVPFAHDQPDNAYRAARLGVARIVDRRRYSVDRVARELGALMEGPQYAAAVRRVAETVQQENGAANACDAIEGFLARAVHQV